MESLIQDCQIDIESKRVEGGSTKHETGLTPITVSIVILFFIELTPINKSSILDPASKFSNVLNRDTLAFHPFYFRFVFMSHKFYSFNNQTNAVMQKSELQVFIVAGAFFREADEMFQLPVYFNNPDLY